MSTSAEKSPKPPSTASRAPGEAFFRAARGGGFFAPVVQAKLTVSKPGDALEKEADRTAEHVMRMPAPAASPVLVQPADRDNSVSRAGAGAPDVSADAQTAIQKATSGGSALSPDVREFVEPRLGADFSQVRIHTDGEAASLSNRLGARAFTHRNHIFFARDEYQPGSSDGRKLLSHELTHTIQQGHSRQSATLQRSPKVTTTASPPAVQRLGIQDALDYFADKAYYIPGFRMLTLLLGFNPINMRSADRTAANLLRALIELLPGGAIITQVLDNHGVINKAAAWVEQKIATLGDIGGQIVDGLRRFIDSLGWRDIFHLGDVWDRAKRIFTDPIGRLISFGVSVVTEILQMVKDAILRPLAALAEGTAGYDLLKAILGQDPITGEPVPRNADTLIGGFMKLIGQEEVWQNLKKGNAVARAWAWFQNALTGLMGLVLAVPRKIIDTLRSLTFQDVITVVGAFRKVVGAFVTIATDFISWGVKQVLGLLEILFSVVAPRAMPYIAKAKAAFHTIIRDPVRFVGNLVRAAKLGFQMFANNIVEHLKNALIKWITGPLGEAGVYIPKSFTLIEIVKLVLSVLGLTWQNIRTKLLKIIPEPVLTALEKTAKIVVTLVTEGPAAAWEEIKSELTELKDQLIGQVTQMISTEVVKAAVIKLVSMLNPAGAVIQAIVATYNTVTFFIEKINQIAAVVASFIDSIAAIASGQVQGAAKKVEQTMANTLTVIVAFLAKFVGLGNVPAKLVGIVKKIRQPIDKGLDRIVGWLGTVLQKLVGAAKAGARKLLNWWKKTVPVSGGGETHVLTFEGSEASATLVIRSDPEKPSVFLNKTGMKKKVGDKERSSPVTKAESYEKPIEAVQKQLRAIDVNDKAAASGKKATEADAAVARLDTHLKRLGQHIGETLTLWDVDDKPVTGVVIPRGKFSVTQKAAIAKEHLKMLFPDATKIDFTKQQEIIRDKQGRWIKLRKSLNLDRRHVVSAHDMGQHYMDVLNTKKLSEAKLLIEQRGSTGSDAIVGATKVAALSLGAIKEAALQRYNKFFGYVKNLFLGDSSENRSIQEHLDAGHPEMAGKKLRDHVRRIKRSWALDKTFEPSEATEE